MYTSIAKVCPLLECNSMDELNLFISESVIMKNFEHRNVLGLIGVSVGIQNDIATPYIILPYMANGDLKGYLQHKRSEAQDDPEVLPKVPNLITLFIISYLYVKGLYRKNEFCI